MARDMDSLMVTDLTPDEWAAMTDDTLAWLGSSVLTTREWALVESEIVRRVESGLTTEWTLA